MNNIYILTIANHQKNIIVNNKKNEKRKIEKLKNQSKIFYRITLTLKIINSLYFLKTSNYAIKMKTFIRKKPNLKLHKFQNQSKIFYKIILN